MTAFTAFRASLLPLAQLCDPCRARWEAWLDYREPRQVQIVMFAGYDGTPAGVADNQRARYERRRETVLSGHRHVVRLCGRFHGRPVERLTVIGGAL